MRRLDMSSPLSAWYYDVTRPRGQNAAMDWLEVTTIELVTCDEVAAAVGDVQLNAEAGV